MSSDSSQHHNVPSEDGLMRSPRPTWNDVQGSWHVYKGKVRQKWGLLTNKDVDLIGGYYEELSGKIQQVYNVSKEEADRQIEEWLMSREDTANMDSGSNPSSSV